jgi:hypothetical protein
VRIEKTGNNFPDIAINLFGLVYFQNDI